MISIVMAYYNRKAQLIETLRSISKSEIKDIEVIVVDDCSSPVERLEDLNNTFPYLKIIRLDKASKWYTNCCVPYNIGIKEAKGDIIIIQNPECLHVHDILKYTVENLTEQNYLSFSCYALSDRGSKLAVNWVDGIERYLEIQPNEVWSNQTFRGWYNHSEKHPVGYHFCSAIMKSNLDKLNGFDERYALGIAYDDDELVARVKRLGLKLEIIDSHTVIHQWHSKVDHFAVENYRGKHERNKNLFNLCTMKEKGFRANG